jgi:cytochrome c2
MKKTFVYVAFSVALLAAACGGNNQSASKDNSASSTAASDEKKPSENPSYDPKRGEGKFTHVDVAATLDPKMADAGEKIYQLKCSSCHKLTDEKLVGPGWKGVSKRKAAEWVMNFVTNTDEMLNKDPEAQSQLEICLVRMPNQNLSDDDARHIYEFMRKNDGVK